MSTEDETLTDEQKYWAEITSTVTRMWADYELISADDCYEAANQLADSHVVYTSSCQRVMQHTRNPDAFAELGLGHVESWSDIVSRVAFFAYRQDLIDEASTWDEDDIFEARQIFRCSNCDEVFSLEQQNTHPEYPDDDDEAFCFECYREWGEDLSLDDDDESEDPEGDDDVGEAA